MKNAIIGFTFCLSLIYIFLIHSCITAKDVRLNELELATNSAVRTTMEQAYTVKSDTEVTTNEQLMELFNENLLTQISSDSDIQVDFMGVDIEEGLLDVKVTAVFHYPYHTVDEPNGVEGKVSVRRTIVLDNTKKKASESGI